MKRFAIIGILLLMSILYADSWILDGDRVYWSENNRMISAAPAFGKGKVITQFVNFSSTNPTSVKANFSFVFDKPILWGKAYYWQNVDHEVQVPTTIRVNYSKVFYNVTANASTSNPCQIGDAQNTFKRLVTHNNGANQTVVCYNSYSVSGSTFTAYYQLNGSGYSTQIQTYPDWNDISSGFSKNIINGKTVFTRYDVDVDNGDNHQLKFVYEVQNIGDSGKYDIVIHRGSPQNPQNLVMLDPWYSSSFTYRMKILCGNTTNPNHPIMINGSGGFSIGGLTQRVWTSCQPDLYLYYNAGNYSTYIVANNTSQVPMEVEFGNGTSYLPSSVWTNASAILVTHFEAKTGVVYDSALGITATVGTYTNATGLWGNAIAFDSGGAGRYIKFPDIASYDLNTVKFEIWWNAPGSTRVNDAVTKYSSSLDWGVASNGGGQHSVIPQKGSGTLTDPREWSLTHGWITANAGNTSKWNSSAYIETTGTATAAALVNGSKDIYIGANPDYNNNANFTIEELRIYKDWNLGTIVPAHNSNWGNESRENQLNRYDGYGKLGAEENNTISIVFVSATPSDLTTVNGANGLKTQYNATNATNLTLFYKTNSSSSDCFAFVNGTNFCGWLSSTSFTNVSTIANWSLTDNGILPGTYNLLNYSTESHSAYGLSNANKAGKLQLYNVSNTSGYGFFELQANCTTPSCNTVIHVSYCNSSYSTGDYSTSPFCTEFGSYLASNSFNHSHSAYSQHWIVPFNINATSGQIGTVKVTPTSYFIIFGSGSPNPDANLYYTLQTARSGASQTTSNKGLTWSDITEFDSHLHQFDLTATYYEYAQMNSGGIIYNSSPIRSDPFNQTALPPTAPGVYSPTESSYVRAISTSLWINYTQSIPVPGANLTHYNISLVDTNLSFVSTIIANNSLNLSYLWNFSLISDGTKIIRVRAFDTNGLYSDGYSAPFILASDIPPTISINLTPSPAYSNDTFNCTFTAYDNDTSPINISWSWRIDGSAVLTYSESRTANLTKTDTKTAYVLGAYPGRNVTCNASASDAYSTATAASTGIVLTNTAPTFTTPTISPSVVYNGTNPTCGFTVTEIDDYDNASILVKWFRNNASVENDSLTNDFTTHGSAAKTTPFNSTLSVGDELYCQVNISDIYGGSAGPTNSSVKIVLNSSLSIPKITSINISPNNPSALDMIFCNVTGYITTNSIDGYCYQESANVPTVCGGLNNGSYAISNWDRDPTNTYDGNWGTYGYTTLIDGIFLINYSKPILSKNATWSLMNQPGVYVNVSIPSECFSDKIELKITNNFSLPLGLNIIKGYCFNSSDWVLLYPGVSGYGRLYEEGIYWFIENSSNNTLSILGNWSINGSVLSGYNFTMLNVANNTNTNVANFTLNASSVGNWTCSAMAYDGFNYSILETSASVPVIPFVISLCNSSPNMNFSFYNQADPTQRLNSTMNMNFWVRNPTLTFSQNISLNQSTPSEWIGICFNAQNGTYYVDSIQEYTSTGYDIQYYYLQRQEFVLPTTLEVSIYLINSSVSYATKYNILELANQPVTNAYLQIQRYYPGTNQFLTVAMAKTDVAGNALGYAIPNDVIYRYVVSKDYSVIFTSNPAPLPCDISSTLCTTSIYVNPTTQNEYSGFIANSLVGCSYDNSTLVVYCSSNNPSGTATAITLELYEIGSYTETLICTNTLSSGSGSVLCNVPSATGRYRFVAYTTVGSIELIGGGYIGFPATTKFNNYVGTLAALIFIFIFAMLGLVGGFSASIVMALIAMIISGLIGFIDISMEATIGITIVGLVIAWILRG